MPKPRSLRAAPSRVVLIDDHAVVRGGLALLLNSQRGLSVCGEAAGSAEGIPLVAALKPDLVLVDISLNGESGLHLIRRLRRLRPAPRILVVSMHEESLIAQRAMRNGANGYIMKQESPERLVAAVRAVLAGRTFLRSEAVAGVLADPSGRRASGLRPDGSLSDRELEVFERIGQGLSAVEIAAALGIGRKTVDTYRLRARRKLRLESSAHLLRAAIRLARV